MSKKKLQGICPFSDFAQLYYPYISKPAAAKKLRKEVERYKSLFEELERIGYTPKEKYLTPAQQLVIIKHFGHYEVV